MSRTLTAKVDRRWASALRKGIVRIVTVRAEIVRMAVAAVGGPVVVEEAVDAAVAAADGMDAADRAAAVEGTKGSF